MKNPISIQPLIATRRSREAETAPSHFTESHWSRA